MDNHQLMGLDLMQIVIFLKAAELERFSKTATELGITTSMVSKHIAHLEKALGFALFDRSKSRVTLTPAGRSLATDWKSLYSSFLYSIEKAAREADRPERPICLGLGSSTNSDRFLVPLLAAYELESGKAEFRVELRRNFDLLGDLMKGVFDLIFLPLFMEERISREHNLDSFVALRHPLVVGMSSDNPLAHKKRILVSDLKQCRLMLVKQPISEEFEKMINQLCIAEGFRPTIGSEIDDVDSAYLNTMGDQVFVTDRLYRQIQTNATLFRDIEGTESGLLAVWRKDAPKNVRDFIQYAREFFGECGI